MVLVGIIVVAAALVLTIPKAISPLASQAIDCQTKLNGRWQTNWGSITFQEKKGTANVIGNYKYENLDRGKVKGTLKGTLHADVLDFEWQELAERGQPKQQGKGSFLLRNSCKDFYGSYGVGDATAGRGNWQGTAVEILPLTK